MDEVTYKRVLTFGVNYTNAAAGAQASIVNNFTFNPQTPLRIIGVKLSARKVELATGLSTDLLLGVTITPYGGSNLPAGNLPATAGLTWTVKAETPKLPLNLLLFVGEVVTITTIAYGSFVLNDTATVTGFIEFVQTH